jgi:hypothetical protein
MNTDTHQAPQLPQNAVMQSVLFNELRIGNVVQFSSGYIYYVDVLYADYVGLKHWFSVPFSKEWFSKLENQIKSLDIKYAFCKKTNRLFLYMGYETIEFRYIHQFQNFYFCLKQLELTVA